MINNKIQWQFVLVEMCGSKGGGGLSLVDYNNMCTENVLEKRQGKIID